MVNNTICSFLDFLLKLCHAYVVLRNTTKEQSKTKNEGGYFISLKITQKRNYTQSNPNHV